MTRGGSAMPEAVQYVVVLAVVIGVGYLILKPRCVFVVRIGRAGPRISRGKVTAAFLQDVAEVCREEGVTGGWVGGVRQGRRISLVFSWGFPAACRQRLRNLWVTHA